MSAIIFNSMILVAICLLLNSTFSMLQYRRHVQIYTPELLEDLQLPLDIKVEAISGMLFGIFVCIVKYTSKLGRIKLQDVMAQKNKTYESTTNMNRGYSMRNLQRSRGGAIFASAKTFPNAHEVMRNNAKLNSIIGRPI